MPRWVIFLGLGRRNGSPDGDKILDRMWVMIMLGLMCAASGVLVDRVLTLLRAPRGIQMFEGVVDAKPDSDSSVEPVQLHRTEHEDALRGP
jgi:hypothetical protein